jgi:polyisoprenoid-binding protein YceI
MSALPALLLAGCASWPVPVGVPRTFVVDPAESRVTVEVGRAGLLKLAGHEHTVTAEGLSGEVMAFPESPQRSSVRVVFAAAAVKVTASDGPAADIPKVQATMSGPKVLDVARFPEIRFASSGVAGRKVGADTWELAVTGDLELHGVRHTLTLPVKVTVRGESLVAEGGIPLRQRDYGIEPVSVGGVVKVKDELALTFRILARAAP